MSTTRTSLIKPVLAVLLIGALWYAAGSPMPPFGSEELGEGDVQLDVTWPSTPQAQIAYGYKPGPDSTGTVGTGGHWRKILHLKHPGTYIVTVSGRPIAKQIDDGHRGRKMVGSISTCTITTIEGQKHDTTPSADPGSMCAVTQVVVVHPKEGH